MWKSEVSIFDVVIKSAVLSLCLCLSVSLTVAFSFIGMSCHVMYFAAGHRDQQTPMLHIMETKYCTQQSEKCWEVACFNC